MKWEKHFQAQILDRGYDYYKLDMVEITNASHKHIDANVEGYNTYNLTIRFENDNIKSMYCSCPYEGNCKHLAATLYYADEHPEIFSMQSDGDIFSDASCDDLKRFLIQEFENDNDLLSRFKVFTKSEVDGDYYLNKLRMSFSNSYNVVKFIDDDLEMLIKNSQYGLVLKLCGLLVSYCEYAYENHDWNAFDYVLDKLDTIMIMLFNSGNESEVLDFLGDIILNNDNLAILEMLTDTYSRIGDVEKLFSEDGQIIEC